ncbi:MAG: hypothetical protein LBQ96_07135 [Fusobacteriaceae bacterium]|nr:hypothetical protein [Fusobacteriaceae bacterium]
MKENYTLFILAGIGILTLIIVIISRGKGKAKKRILVEDVLESYYYRYGGDVNWIRRQLGSYRFKSLSSMLSSKTPEEADFRIDILETEDGKKMNVYATDYSYKATPKLERILGNLRLTEIQYGKFLENVRETYVAKGADAIREHIHHKKKDQI